MGDSTHSSVTLASMIGELLREPFAVDTSLHTMNFEAVGKLLEEVAEEFVTNATDSQDSGLRLSYDRCKELYVSILMEAESNPGALGDQPLGELAFSPEEKPTPPKKAKKYKNSAREVKAEIHEKAEETELPSQSRSKGPSDERALEYWNARSSLGAAGLPSPLSCRFETQCLAFALETEGRVRLSSGILGFWKKRAEALSAVADIEHGAVVRQELMDVLHELGAERTDWLENGLLPDAAIRGAIRFLAHAPAKTAFEPSLIEMGLILILFGSDDPLRGWSRTNLIGHHGLHADELIEIFFRLMRAQGLRNGAMNPSTSIEPAHLDKMKENVDRTFELMDRIVVSDEPVKKAKKDSA